MNKLLRAVKAADEQAARTNIKPAGRPYKEVFAIPTALWEDVRREAEAEEKDPCVYATHIVDYDGYRIGRTLAVKIYASAEDAVESLHAIMRNRKIYPKEWADINTSNRPYENVEEYERLTPVYLNSSHHCCVIAYVRREYIRPLLIS